MSTPSHTWERLRQERERLGLSQAEFAARGGVQKWAQIKYEQGARKPDSNYLAGIAAAGADVEYILTGQTAALRDTLQFLKEASTTVQTLGLPQRYQMFVRDVLFGVALKKADLIITTIEEFLAEHRSPPSDGGKSKRKS